MPLNRFTATLLACAALGVVAGALWLVARFIEWRSHRGRR